MGILEEGTELVGVLEDGTELVGILEEGAELLGALEDGTELVGILEEGAELLGLLEDGTELVGILEEGTELVGVLDEGIELVGILEEGSELLGLLEDGTELVGILENEVGSDEVGVLELGAYVLEHLSPLNPVEQNVYVGRLYPIELKKTVFVVMFPPLNIVSIASLIRYSIPPSRLYTITLLKLRAPALISNHAFRSPAPV